MILAVEPESKLPPLSSERLENFISKIQEITFPVELQVFIERLGGEKEITLSGYSGDTITLLISARNAAGGDYGIQLRYKKKPEKSLQEALCDEPRIIYFSESPFHYFVLDEPLQIKTNR